MADKINLSPEEKQLYGQLFKQGDPEGLGIVTGEVSRTLFERSGLPSNVLGEIWQIADTENQGFLNQLGFSLALRLIGHVQSGKQVSIGLGSTPGPLPKFNKEGLAPNATGARVPPLTPVDRARFGALFEKSAPNGVLDGDSARNIFLKARLPNETLGRVWNLADTRARGQLDQTEFVIAMHLIQATMSGQLRQLPQTLPPGLYEAASGAGTGRPASRSSIGSNNAPIPRQYSGYRNSSVGGAPGGFGGADVIVPAERAKFDAIFRELDKNKRGLLGPDEIVPFLTTSKLPEQVLAQVWDLADYNNSGEFGRGEFAIAMHLVQQKLMGRELPAILPQSLLNGPQPSRQTSVSSSFGVPTAGPNPLFFPGSGSPSAEQTQFRQPQPKPAAPVNQSSMNDLVSLNDIFSSPGPASPKAGPPGPAGAASGQRQASQEKEVRPFVPTSSFGQSLKSQDSGRSSVSNAAAPSQQPPSAQPVSSQAPAAVPATAAATTAPGFTASGAPALAAGAAGVAIGAGGAAAAAPAVSRDLFLDGSESGTKLSQATTEFANLSNQISSLTQQSVGLTDRREKSESELARTLEAKKDIEGRLATLRSGYDGEVKRVKEVEDNLDSAKKEHAQLSQDYSVLEASINALRQQYEQTAGQLSGYQQENAQLKEKIRITNEQTAELKEQLSKAQRDAQQQQGLVNINSKQLSVSEDERSKLESEIDGIHAQQTPRGESPTHTFGSGHGVAAGAAIGAAAGVAGLAGAAAIGESTAASSGSGRTPSPGNPFFSGNFTQQPAPAQHLRGPGSFEDSFNQLEVASPSTAEPAPSSTHNTVDTPNSSPPTSDFHGYGGETTQTPTFTLPIERPQSATSSVQNNPPQSVRGDLDVSRPDSPEETSQPVSGIVPPQDLETGIEAPSTASGSTRTEGHDGARGAHDTQFGSELAPPPYGATIGGLGDSSVTAKPVVQSPGGSSESFEIVDHHSSNQGDERHEQGFGQDNQQGIDAQQHGQRYVQESELNTEADHPSDHPTDEAGAFGAGALAAGAAGLGAVGAGVLGAGAVSGEGLGSGVPGAFPDPSPVDTPAATPAATEGAEPTASGADEDRTVSAPSFAEPELEATRRSPVAHSKFAQEFPPLQRFEPEDSDSEEEDGHLAPGSAANGDRGERRASTSSDGYQYTSAQSSPVSRAVETYPEPSEPAPLSSAPEGAQQPNALTGGNAPKATVPSVLAPSGTRGGTGDDIFGNAFTGLTDAQEETGAGERSLDRFDFAFDNAFGSPQSGVPPQAPSGAQGASSFSPFGQARAPASQQAQQVQAPPAAPLAAPTTQGNSQGQGDEWEQLFADFSKPVQSPAVNDLDDAFSVRKPSGQPPAVPKRALTPKSEAIENLTNMGFSHNDAEEALKAKDYNVEAASNYLLDR